MTILLAMSLLIGSSIEAPELTYKEPSSLYLDTNCARYTFTRHVHQIRPFPTSLTRMQRNGVSVGQDLSIVLIHSFCIVIIKFNAAYNKNIIMQILHTQVCSSTHGPYSLLE